MKRRRRIYGQYCGLAGALDLVGERWTLLIVRELLVGPCRYNQLQSNLPGIGTNLLAERLRFLTEAGLVRQRGREGSKVRLYELTEQGEGLREPVLALARWGSAPCTRRAPRTSSALGGARSPWRRWWTRGRSSGTSGTSSGSTARSSTSRSRAAGSRSATARPPPSRRWWSPRIR
ncbi:helix-turn-helix domain-containing protein [Actinomadura sp. J1-007]|uniref:winged helix-turn-helix transcriptional regulator n=1 Tax=Actinomadura sp. J1-007 TaxID=2661913 RepID=UPI0028157CC7|nr:helix-turn-helix domain-containing protein [Actinomadura sp. J1-007]